MVKKKRSNVRNIALVIAIIFLVVGLHEGWFENLGTQSVIGEEQYHAYDDLLVTGSFDRGDWLYSPSQTCQWTGTPGISGTVEPWDTISASTDKITVGIFKGVDPCIPVLSTKNLYLKDFKVSFESSANRCGTNKNNQGHSCVYANNQVLWCLPDISGRDPHQTVSVEVRWDDYRAGHYQVFVNEVLKKEGVASETNGLFITTKSDSENGWDECGASSSFINPRVAEVFGCDLQAGEVKAVKTFATPGVFDINDLPGWKRFCTNVESYHFDNGVAGTSAQVYYALAQGEDVTVGDNEYWEVTYLADANAVGVTDDLCEYFNVDKDNCTGSVHFCENFVPGVGCLTLAEDFEDIPVPDPVVEDQTLWWSSYGFMNDGLWIHDKLNLRLYSGENEIMHVPWPDVTCGWPGNHVAKYPGNAEGCLELDSFNNNFLADSRISVGDFLKVEIDDFTARYYETTHGKNMKYVATWRLDFDKDAISAEITDGESSYVLNDDSTVTAKVQNNLPFDAEFRVSSVSTDGLGEQTTESHVVNIGVGKDKEVVFSLPTETLGDANIRVSTVLITEVGDVLFADMPLLNYHVAEAGVVDQNQSTNSSVTTGGGTSTVGGEGGVSSGSTTNSANEKFDFGAISGENIIIIVGVLLLLFFFIKMSQR